MQEPMVTIKKADGTTERVPLSQVRAQKKQPAPAATVAPQTPRKETKMQKKKVVEQARVQEPPLPPKKKRAPKPMPKATRVAPAPPAPKPAAPMKKQEKKIAPPEPPKPKKAAPPLPPAPKKDMQHWDNDDHVSLLDDSLHEELPAVVDRKKTALSTSAPVKDIFVDEAAAQMKKAMPKTMDAHIAQHTPAPSPISASRKIQKPKMHDIAPGSGVPMPPPVPTQAPQHRKQSVGPVDELGSMTIEDFRRLGGNVEAMNTVFMGKFRGLRKESFMMYADGVRAWRRSPLFLNYLHIISQSLQNKQPVDATISSVGGMKKEEFDALVMVNKKIGM